MYAEDETTEETRALTVMPAITFTPQKLDLLKRTVAQGTSDDEFALFVEVAKRMQLDPFSHQLHAVMRYDAKAGREKMVIQIGIDGYFAIADRTGEFAGIDPVIYGPTNADGYPESAQVTGYRFRQGQRVAFTHQVWWDEYVQTTKDGKPNSMWRKMPRGQLGKCAKAGLLRMMFPFQLSGVYVDEEMAQADSESYVEPASHAHTSAQTRPQPAAQRPAASKPAAKPATAKPSWSGLRKRALALGMTTQDTWAAFCAECTGKSDPKTYGETEYAVVEHAIAKMEQAQDEAKWNANTDDALPEVPATYDLHDLGPERI